MQTSSADGGGLYMLREGALKPGDIVLSRSAAMVSLGIAHFTGGEFSHAAIVLGSGVYAEAVTRGVRKRSVGTVVAPRLAVMRVDGMSDQDRATLVQRAVDEAEHFVSLKYSMHGALTSPLESIHRDLFGRMFCSQLVATAFERAGLALVHGKQAHNVTPSDLAASLRLRDVSEQAVVRPESVPPYLLDGHLETLSDREADAAQIVFADSITWFDEHRLDRPEHMMDVFRALARMADSDARAELDRLLQRSLLDSGYLGLMKQVLLESVIPFQRQTDELDYSSLTNAELKDAGDVLTRKQADLGVQAREERDSQDLFDGLAKEHHLGSFDLLARRSETNAELSEGLARAIDKRLERIRRAHSN